MGRKQTTGEGECWGWELLNCDLISVIVFIIKTETPPAKALYINFFVTWSNLCPHFYWVLVLWLFLFTNCTVSIERFITTFFSASVFTIHSSHLEELIQEAVAGPIMICHPQIFVCFFLGCFFLTCLVGLSVALALPAILLVLNFAIDFGLAPELAYWSFFFPCCLSSQN